MSARAVRSATTNEPKRKAADEYEHLQALKRSLHSRALSVSQSDNESAVVHLVDLLELVRTTAEKLGIPWQELNTQMVLRRHKNGSYETGYVSDEHLSV